MADKNSTKSTSDKSERSERPEKNGRTEKTPDKIISMDIASLQKKTIAELNRLAGELNIEGHSGMRKQELIFAILGKQAE